MADTQPDAAVDAHLAEAKKCLKGHLSAAQLKAYLDDAKSRILSRKEALISSGMSPYQAEAVAIRLHNLGRLKSGSGNQRDKVAANVGRQTFRLLWRTKALNPIDKFVGQAVNTLKLILPDEKLHTVVAEARCHLEDSAAEFAATGLDPIEAENQAVKAFGNYDKWTRSIVDAFYVDARSPKADAFAFVCAAVLLCAPAFQSMFNCIFLGSAIDIAMGVLIIACLGARFLSRSSKDICSSNVFGVILAVSFFVFSTQWVVMGPARPTSLMERTIVPRSIISRDFSLITSNASTEPPRASIPQGTEIPLIPADLLRKRPLWTRLITDDNDDISVTTLRQTEHGGKGFDAMAGLNGLYSIFVVFLLLWYADRIGVFFGRLAFRTLKRRKAQTD